MEGSVLPFVPVPPFTPMLVLGDTLVFGLLLLLQARQHRLAIRAATGHARALYQWRVAAYQKLMMLSGLITAVPYLLWFAFLYLLPWSLSYTTPLPLIVGIAIRLPFLVWATPVVAVLIELAELRDA